MVSLLASGGFHLPFSLVRMSFPLIVSQDEGSLGDQQWSSSVGHVQGVDSDRDTHLRDLNSACIGLTYASLLRNPIVQSPLWFLITPLKPPCRGPNGPEALREDNIRKNEVVVLFGDNAMPILREEHASIKVMHRGIVHHDSIPKFNSFDTSEEDVVYVLTVVATNLTTRVDILASFVKVVGARDFLVIHEPDEGFDFVGTSHVPDPVKLRNPLIWCGVGGF
ncbi:hypothetical protein KY290_037388 [Solanum tuberosum]|uniref:Uncharacterized protein n=1 Tax=Solanum tuberosum TaxID=4113 RepID=A0ABQ7TWU7_SOLTU|nr:hypothetical protein KY290_037388 [Solanum tuberosum]